MGPNPDAQPPDRLVQQIGHPVAAFREVQLPVRKRGRIQLIRPQQIPQGEVMALPPVIIRRIVPAAPDFTARFVGAPGCAKNLEVDALDIGHPRPGVVQPVIPAIADQEGREYEIGVTGRPRPRGKGRHHHAA